MVKTWISSWILVLQNSWQIVLTDFHGGLIKKPQDICFFRSIHVFTKPLILRFTGTFDGHILRDFFWSNLSIFFIAWLKSDNSTFFLLILSLASMSGR